MGWTSGVISAAIAEAMGGSLVLEPCKCGGVHLHHRRTGSDRALCGRLLVDDQSNLSGPTCFSCAKRKKELEELAAATTQPPARTYQLAAVNNGDEVHLVETRPASPEWTTKRTVCGRKVDALISYKTEVSCKRCRAGASPS